VLLLREDNMSAFEAVGLVPSLETLGYGFVTEIGSRMVRGRFGAFYPSCPASAQELGPAEKLHRHLAQLSSAVGLLLDARWPRLAVIEWPHGGSRFPELLPVVHRIVREHLQLRAIPAVELSGAEIRLVNGLPKDADPQKVQLAMRDRLGLDARPRPLAAALALAAARAGLLGRPHREAQKPHRTTVSN
jgi:hypothetical protein